MNVDVDFIVTWEGPKDDGGDPNLKYSLEWRKKPINANTEVSKEENIQETQFKITGLDYGSEYEVKLFAVNEAGDSEADTKDFKTTQEPGKSYSQLHLRYSYLSLICITKQNIFFPDENEPQDSLFMSNFEGLKNKWKIWKHFSSKNM